MRGYPAGIVLDEDDGLVLYAQITPLTMAEPPSPSGYTRRTHTAHVA